MTVDHKIPAKATRVLNVILLAMLLILIRVWYLGVIQHEEQVAQAQKPQRRTVIEPVERATIYDRFNIPLAVNKMQYNAAVCYANIRQIPSIIWKKGANGKAQKIMARTEHIKTLSTLLGKELNMDPVFIEDTIHGKASLFPHTPFVIKEDITEEQYYRLRMLEKDWLGIQTQRAAQRFYPQGKTGCDILGYLGAISQKKYLDIAEEMRELEGYISAREQYENPVLPKGFDHPSQVRARLHELQEKAYTINDLIGKAGLEAKYEEELRGIRGKTLYEVDVKGNFLRQLPGSRKSSSGRRLILSISAELQAYAEALLAANEGLQSEDQPLRLDENWIKGGAIVAMIPKTGEVVAMASYPRFDPNDFIPTRDPETKKDKEAAVQKWLESPAYIGEIWDGKRLLDRERFSFPNGRYEQDALLLTWEKYLETTIPPTGAIRSSVNRISTIQDAIQVQDAGAAHPLLQPIALPEDKMLLVDLCRLAAKKEFFSKTVLDAAGSQPLSEYFSLRQAAMRTIKAIKGQIEELFHDHDFTVWREAYFKEYLKRKRKEEKELKKYAHPYTEYLDEVEKKLFHAFWDAYKLVFLYTAVSGNIPISLEKYPHLQPYLAFLKGARQTLLQNDKDLPRLQATLAGWDSSIGLSYLQTMRSFEELNEQLLGRYPRLRNERGQQLGKHLAAAFYPFTGYGYGRSQAYRQLQGQGSVFKLVTAYQGLLERYQQQKRDLNPLTLIDDLKGDKKTNLPTQILGYTLDQQPITRMYKGGMLPRSSRSNIGKIDILGAIERSSNVYFAILAGEHMQDPDRFAETTRMFGFGDKTGIDLPLEVRGNVPDDLASNKTGLYSFSIGQHTLTVTPIQTAVMIATIANKGDVVKPRIVKTLAGKEISREEDVIFSATKFPFQDPLSLVGIDFPLFTAVQNEQQRAYAYQTPAEIVRSLFFPPEIYKMITEGMRRAVLAPMGSARPSIMRSVYGDPNAAKDYYELKDDIIAKTGTPQVRYKQFIDRETPSEMQRHIWFACISYPPEKRLASDRDDNPELVVVVLLRYRSAGREGGPLAAQVIKKWREICKKHAI
jgi:cell division protein FtsI/penicillin-binding protein 2